MLCFLMIRSKLARLLFFTAGLLLQIVFISNTATAASVQVGLHASWPHTSTAAEAALWIAEHMGNQAVLPFLNVLAAEVDEMLSQDGKTAITHQLEHELVNTALASLNYNSFLSSTLNWVLHARQYSSYVHMHYSIANETLAAFKNSDTSAGDAFRISALPDIFAVSVDHTGTQAQLLFDPKLLGKCKDCAKVRSAHASEDLSFALKLPREISLSESCSFGDSAPTVLIYADLLSLRLDSWLKAVESVAKKCEFRLALRFCKSSSTQGNDGIRPGLQGYVVTAALKGTEYNVTDDRKFSIKLFDDCSYGESNCSLSERSLDDGLAWSEANGNAWNPPRYTGMKVLSYLRDTADGDVDKAIEVLRSFTEDTPSVTRSKQFQEHPEFKTEEAKEISNAVKKFRVAIGDEDYLFINSRPFDIHTVMQNSERFFRCLSTIAASTIAHNAEPAALEKSEGSLRVDLQLSENLPTSLVWFNNMYNDSRYKKWKPLDVNNETDVAGYRAMIEKAKEKREPLMQLAKVRAHVLSLVVLLDPGDMQQFMYTSIPETVVRSDLPIRVGMVLVPNGRVSSLVTASFHYFLRSKGRRTCVKFIHMIRQVLEYVGVGYQQVPLTEQIVELAFRQMVHEGDSGYVSAGSLLEQDEEIKQILDEAREFAKERRLFTEIGPDESNTGSDVTQEFSMLGLLNGLVLRDISADALTFSLSEQKRIAHLLESDVSLFGDDSVPDFQRWVSSDPNLIVVERLSQEMRSGDKRLSRFKTADDLKRLPASTVLALREELKDISYITSAEATGEDRHFAITVWLAAKDRTSDVFHSMLGFFKELASSEFALRTNARFGVLDESTRLHAKVLQTSIGPNSENVLCVLNGRVVSPSSLTSIEDLKVEIASEYNVVVHSHISDDERLLRSMFRVEISSACATNSEGSRGAPGDASYGEVMEVMGSSNMSRLMVNESLQGERPAQITVFAIINPLGANAFVAPALLDALRNSYGSESVSMTLVLATTASELKSHIKPPSTFSKFILGSKNHFHDGSGERVPPRASFLRLSQKNITTFGVEPPRAWFVSSFATNHDMDNVVLRSLSEAIGVLNAEYELKSLIVEGSCVDEKESPPQGLKLILENDAGLMVDTLVMANLGYFQLKVPNPGRWSLRLAKGPSSIIFSLKVMEMYSGNIRTVYKADRKGRVPIIVESLGGAGGILLRVERNPGMEGMSVLNPNGTVKAPSKKGVGEKLKETFSRLYWRPNADKDVEMQEPSHDSKMIHVFSVASGHLYERFLKIMMSSATKHATRPIKFWLLENYLSPSFKKMLPHFAKELGCEVGMVTYKWPGWLRAQTEKQRIIWAYKILFLDVLFPLDVGRIIFVDSDQVLRGDLAELMDINLQGAPYGYVPFCDSRSEVEGYRFWKQGFWKETLQGQKYHISALYVVDLIQFRETAAGDTLRVIYQSLSADPNSLSNLDQDLPNYASVNSMGRSQNVPIFDLPAEWLWCESWCDDESKKSAKAIDLCNNPMTKEPKLQSAKRIISEWVDYDDAATELTEQIYRRLANSENNSSEESTEDRKCSAGGRCEEADEGSLSKTEL